VGEDTSPGGTPPGRPVALRGCFVTATDTGVGKTILSAALVAALRAKGLPVHARKPVMTGLEDGPPLDHELLASASGEPATAVSPWRYGPAVSPHLAAELAGEQLDVDALIADVRAAGEPVIVEGIGGLLVPLAQDWDVRRLARELGLGVVIAARPGLGTINHTLLTLEAARMAALDVRAVVLTPWPADPGPIERSNAATIERLGGVAVATLPALAEISAATLAAAGAALPYESWLV
jgi:dethiobiotin synthetase